MNIEYKNCLGETTQKQYNLRPVAVLCALVSCYNVEADYMKRVPEHQLYNIVWMFFLWF